MVGGTIILVTPPHLLVRTWLQFIAMLLEATNRSSRPLVTSTTISMPDH